MTIREAFGKLAAATAKGMKNPFFVIRNLHKEFKDIQENVTSCGLIQDAKDIDYDNTNSGLTAEDAQAAIDELAGAVDDADTEIATIDGRVDTLEGKVDRGTVSVTADGTKTYGELLVALYELIDMTKISPYWILEVGTRVLPIVGYNTTTNNLDFSRSRCGNSKFTNDFVAMRSTLSATHFYSGSAETASITTPDLKNDVPASGEVLILHY